jgi:hypothetical protein
MTIPPYMANYCRLNISTVQNYEIVTGRFIRKRSVSHVKKIPLKQKKTTANLWSVVKKTVSTKTQVFCNTVKMLKFWESEYWRLCILVDQIRDVKKNLLRTVTGLQVICRLLRDFIFGIKITLIKAFLCTGININLVGFLLYLKQYFWL